MRASVFFVGTSYGTVIKKLNAKGISISRLKLLPDGISFSVYRGVDEALELLKSEGYEFRLVKDGRRKTFLKKNLPRFGLYIGLIIGIISILFYSRCITRVTVAGNRLVSDEVVTERIFEEISLPTDKKNFSAKEIEKKIISLEGIFSASVYVKGNVLHVTVAEEPEQPSVLDRTEFRDVVSELDGVITRITTYSGTPVVAVGDSVKKGQTLISCTRELPDGIVIKENALGDIYARVWISEETVFTPTVLTKKRTGRTEKRVGFFAPPDVSECGFSSYETETRERRLYGIVPLVYYETVCYETAEAETEFDFDGNEESIVKYATERAENSLPEGSVPIRTWYDVKRLDKNIVLVIYYEIEKKIG